MMAPETKVRLKDLSELMGRELGTGLTLGQTLEIAVMEALAKRKGPDVAGAGDIRQI